MTKSKFLAELGVRLSRLPVQDAAASLEYYSEMIDDRMEEGMDEDSAVAAMGDMDEIVKGIVGEMPLGRLIYQRIKPSRPLRVFEIVLLVLGSPIWLAVAISLFAVFLSVYVSLWSVLISCYAGVVGGLVGGVVGGLGGAVLFAIKGSLPSMLLMLGGALACFGIFLPLCLCLNKLTVLGVRWSKSFLHLVKSLFVKGGEQK